MRTIIEKRAGENDIVCGDGSSDADGTRVCDKCGKILAVDLTLSGVESELEHFETYPPESNLNHRRHLIDTLQGIEHVELESIAVCETEKRLYQRVIALVNNYLVVGK